jgi:hypothetical protein
MIVNTLKSTDVIMPVQDICINSHLNGFWLLKHYCYEVNFIVKLLEGNVIKITFHCRDMKKIVEGEFRKTEELPAILATPTELVRYARHKKLKNG